MTTTTSTASTQTDRLRALAGEQLARDRWSRDRLLAFQAERLRALIAHAVVTSPYYRDLLGPDAATGEVPLAELPTLPKATLMDNFDRIVTDPRLRRAELEAHLAGKDADRPYLGRYRLFSTAGTTGLRGLFVDGLEEFAVWLGTCLRDMASWGLGPGTRLAGIGSPNPLGLPYARIAAVDGRSDDLITLPGAGGRPVTVYPFRLRAPFAELLEVRQYQVVHDPAGLQVAVVLREDAPAGLPDRIAAALTGLRPG
jgi:phenylacetate-coenzyme A ligase PaaK-like adenylate-forming protein